MRATVKSEIKEVRKYATAELEIIKKKQARKAGTPTGLGVLLVGVIAALFVLLFPFNSQDDQCFVFGVSVVEGTSGSVYHFYGIWADRAFMMIF